MTGRRFLTTTLVLIFALSLLSGALQADHTANRNAESSITRSTLHTIHDYVAPIDRNGIHFAIEDSILYAGTPSRWRRVSTPPNVLVSSIAVDYQDNNRTSTIYIGAVNQLALYHSADFGESWVYTPLADQEAGGVTEITLDTTQKVLYVGTDTSGIYRLRDTGSALRINNHVLIDRPIIEIETDHSGAGIAYARTEWQLYRADQYGMRWFAINGLPSAPTALAIADTTPTTIYVGTVEQGIFKSTNGREWTPHNYGLNYGVGNRLKVNALAVDQTDPNVLYTSISHLFGSRNMWVQPGGTYMTIDGATWDTMQAANGQAPIIDLFPVHGESGMVFALTDQSPATKNRLTNAQQAGSIQQVVDAQSTGNQSTVNSQAAVAEVSTVANGWNRRLISWAIAGLAAFALLFAALFDIRKRVFVTFPKPVVE